MLQQVVGSFLTANTGGQLAEQSGEILLWIDLQVLSADIVTFLSGLKIERQIFGADWCMYGGSLVSVDFDASGRLGLDMYRSSFDGAKPILELMRDHHIVRELPTIAVMRANLKGIIFNLKIAGSRVNL